MFLVFLLAFILRFKNDPPTVIKVFHTVENQSNIKKNLCVGLW